MGNRNALHIFLNDLFELFEMITEGVEATWPSC